MGTGSAGQCNSSLRGTAAGNLEGFNVTEENVGEDAGVTVNVACLELDPRVAVIVTSCSW